MKKKKGERADGLIQRSITIGRNPDGSLKRKYFYGHTIAEAERKLQDYKAKIDNQLDPAKPELTVSEWVDIWYSQYVVNIKRVRPLSKSTRSGYKSRIDQLKSAIGNRSLKSIKEVDLQNALSNVRGESKDAATKYAGMIKRIFGKARANQMIDYNPAECLDTPIGKKGTHRALERWEVDLILNHWQEHRAGLWAMIMLLTGMRRGELVVLSWNNIDFDNRTISITSAGQIDDRLVFVEGDTKSPAGVRTLPICTKLLDALNTVPQERRFGRVCLDINSKPLTPTSFRNGWKGFRKAMWRIANNEPIEQRGSHSGNSEEGFDWRAHDLRFTFATAMYDAGIKEKAMQYFMGHSDLRLTLELYTQLSDERKKRSAQQASTFLDGWLVKGESKHSADELAIFQGDVKMM